METKISKVANLLDQEWQTRKVLAPGVTTDTIEHLMNVACQNGAWSAKVCGAGGGGCVTFLTPADKKMAVSEALTNAGGQILGFHLSATGLQVMEK
jgi:D-glycero-alpha-D-manno-heptose-7-phosphate kinase